MKEVGITTLSLRREKKKRGKKIRRFLFSTTTKAAGGKKGGDGGKTTPSNLYAFYTKTEEKGREKGKKKGREKSTTLGSGRPTGLQKTRVKRSELPSVVT